MFSLFAKLHARTVAGQHLGGLDDANVVDAESDLKPKLADTVTVAFEKNLSQSNLYFCMTLMALLVLFAAYKKAPLFRDKIDGLFLSFIRPFLLSSMYFSNRVRTQPFRLLALSNAVSLTLKGSEAAAQRGQQKKRSDAITLYRKAINDRDDWMRDFDLALNSIHNESMAQQRQIEKVTVRMKNGRLKEIEGDKATVLQEMLVFDERIKAVKFELHMPVERLLAEARELQQTVDEMKAFGEQILELLAPSPQGQLNQILAKCT